MIEEAGAAIDVGYLTPNARAWIRVGGVARVLHVFERSCNLIDERGEILSLVTADLDAGPFSMLVEPLAPAFDTWVKQDTSLSLDGDGLSLGGLKIDLDGAEIWDPRPDWQALSQSVPDLIDWLPIVQEVLATKAPENSLAHLSFIDPAHGGAEHHGTGVYWDRMMRAAAPAASVLCEGLIQADSVAIQNGASRLAGLGPGLTPAGDDFILGAALATWLVYPFEVAEPLVAVMSANAVPHTTALSAAWIRAAARAEAGKRWHDLFSALSTKSETGFERSLLSLAAVGHTSGSDALAGFFSVLELYAESDKL